MSDTILRRAHMSAVREISDLNTKIRRLESGLIIAECMNQYLAARMQLHGKPYKMDVAILSLGQMAMNAQNDEDAALAVDALRAIMEQARKFTTEAIEEAKDDPDFYGSDEATADEIVRNVLRRIDEKLLAYQQELSSAAGFTKEDLEELKRAIDEKFGRAEDSE